MKIASHTIRPSRIKTLAGLAALVAAPLLTSTQAAHAKPPAHAKVYGYYKNHGKDRDDKATYADRKDQGYQNNDSRHRNDYSGSSTLRTLSGTVSRHYADNVFELRASNGHTYTVRTRRAEPLSLSVGDRVTVSGRFSGHEFIADTLRITRNDDRHYVNFPATVTSVHSNSLVVRNNRGTFTVISRSRLSRSISHGDLVRVEGQQQGHSIVSATVTLLRNG